MCKGSVIAQNLYRKAKTGRRLSPKEVMLVRQYASRMRETVGEDNIKVVLPSDILPGTQITVPPELLLHGDRAILVMKGTWLADTVSGLVVGKLTHGTLTLFPNSVILVNDLARLLRCLKTN